MLSNFMEVFIMLNKSVNVVIVGGSYLVTWNVESVDETFR